MTVSLQTYSALVRGMHGEDILAHEILNWICYVSIMGFWCRYSVL